jgi:hypothetical protein
VSEFLDRLLIDVRERLAASREAVREYEQLQRALAALDGVDNGGAPRPRSTRQNADASSRVRRRRTGTARSTRSGGNRKRLLAVVGERPGVTREELESVTGFSTAVVAQNLRRMVARGALREQQLPGGQIGYATSPVDPHAARPATGDGTDGTDAETASASDPVAAESA